jgi:hypothetical protein
LIGYRFKFAYPLVSEIAHRRWRHQSHPPNLLNTLRLSCDVRFITPLSLQNSPLSFRCGENVDECRR